MNVKTYICLSIVVMTIGMMLASKYENLLFGIAPILVFLFTYDWIVFTHPKSSDKDSINKIKNCQNLVDRLNCSISINYCNKNQAGNNLTRIPIKYSARLSGLRRDMPIEIYANKMQHVPIGIGNDANEAIADLYSQICDLPKDATIDYALFEEKKVLAKLM